MRLFRASIRHPGFVAKWLLAVGLVLAMVTIHVTIRPAQHVDFITNNLRRDHRWDGEDTTRTNDSQKSSASVDTSHSLDPNHSLIQNVSGENKTRRVSSDQHPSVFPVTLPLAEELLSVLTEKGQLALRQSLHTLRIYIFPLPGVFNSDLPHQATERRRDLCFSFTNDGLGPELEHTPGESIHRTHQFASEVIFHRLLIRSPFLTSNLSEAHLVYVPFYAGLACLARSPLADGKLFWDILLQPNSSIHTGIPHFMTLAKVEQEMSSVNCPILRSESSHLLKYLMIERTYKERTRKYFRRLGKENEILVVPYPTFVHYDATRKLGDDTFNALAKRKRSIYVYMAASLKRNDLRHALAKQLRSTSGGMFMQLSMTECTLTQEQHTPVTLVKQMQNSLFCLQPPGDTPTRKSFFDCILAGCIPVIFMEGVAYPFQEFIDYSKFTVYINENDITQSNQTIFDILQTIPQSVGDRMRESVQAVAQLLQYSLAPVPEDAFTFALRSLLDRLHAENRTINLA